MKIPLLLSLIAGVSTVIGSILIFFKYKKINRLIVISLSFSLAIMTLISVFDLLPDSSIKLINNYGVGYGLLLIILTFLLGYLSIEKINNRIKTNNNSSLYKIGVLSMISLMLHNFPEGIAVFMGAYTNIHLGLKLCLAIMLHNIPEGIAISIPLYYSGVGKKKTCLYTLLSGLSEPVGALLAYVLLKNFINNIFLAFVLIFVAGLMISLSLNDILREVKNYRDNKHMIIGFSLATVIFIISMKII